jgi:DNA polymerase-4
MERTILLVDMNAFFASVEQLINPALRGKPIVVCGEGRTVVTTSSYEARAFGVKTGMNLYEARRVCPQVIPVVGNHQKYIDTSLRLHQIMLEFTDQVQPFSIDECFMDVTHLTKKKTPKEIAQDLKNRIKERTGLLCSVGVGPNKLLAKMGSKMQKPDGLTEIRMVDVPELFARLKVEEVGGIGIGRKLSVKLKSLGLNTLHDVGAAPISMLTAHFGIMGYHLQRMGRGENEDPVALYDAHDQIKSVGHSLTLPADTRDMKVVRSYLRMLAEKVGVRLREAGMTGRVISLVIRYGDFTSFSKQRTLKQHIKSGYDIYFNADKILTGLLPLPKSVRLVGVSISDLIPDEKQGFLLEDMEKKEKLTQVMDEINRKYGDFTIKPSSIMAAEEYSSKDHCGLIGRHHFKKRTPQK